MAEAALRATSTSRDHQLDILRGVAVVGMFFFSSLLTLSDRLPLMLRHNEFGKLLPGDFVVTTFLFSSGVSIQLLMNRYPSILNRELWRKLSKRLLVMLLVSIVVTPFSVSELLGMDEVMLNLVLTIPAVLLSACGVRFSVAAVVMICGAYAVFHAQIPFESRYLGGYPGAVFFFPAMLAGMFLSERGRSQVWVHALLWGCGAVLLAVVLGRPDKLRVTPSFVALSSCVSLLLIGFLDRLRVECGPLEYFGKHSLRMWFLLFAMLGPVRLYAEVSLHTRQLSLSTTEALGISVGWMVVSYGMSKLLDWGTKKLNR